MSDNVPHDLHRGHDDDHFCLLPPSQTMASTLARLQRIHAHTPFSIASSSTRALVYLPSHRHAMMSALSRDGPSPPPQSTTSTASTSSSPLLGETPPVVVPSSKPPSAKDLSPNAASPQVAARPPPVPKAERPRPKIRATKAAITLVSVSSRLMLRVPNTTTGNTVDTYCCRAATQPAQESDTAADSYRCAEQGLRWAVVPSRVR